MRGTERGRETRRQRAQPPGDDTDAEIRLGAVERARGSRSSCGGGKPHVKDGKHGQSGNDGDGDGDGMGLEEARTEGLNMLVELHASEMFSGRRGRNSVNGDEAGKVRRRCPAKLQATRAARPYGQRSDPVSCCMLELAELQVVAADEDERDVRVGDGGRRTYQQDAAGLSASARAMVRGGRARPWVD
jgi:hypothetical protein